MKPAVFQKLGPRSSIYAAGGQKMDPINDCLVGGFNPSEKY